MIKISKKTWIKIISFLIIGLLSYASFSYLLPKSPQVLAEKDTLSEIDKTTEFYSDPKKRTEQALAIFHTKIEYIVNMKMAIMLETYINVNKDAKNRCPDEPKKETKEFSTIDDCAIDSKNFSTACVAKLISIEFNGLQKAMEERKKFVNEQTSCDFSKLQKFNNHYAGQNQAKGQQTFDVAFRDSQAKVNFINSELNIYNKAIDLTLKAYDEFYWSYPMHVQYKETIRLLKQLNDELIEVRKKIENYKGKFDNATTVKCT